MDKEITFYDFYGRRCYKQKLARIIVTKVFSRMWPYDMGCCSIQRSATVSNDDGSVEAKDFRNARQLEQWLERFRER